MVVGVNVTHSWRWTSFTARSFFVWWHLTCASTQICCKHSSNIKLPAHLSWQMISKLWDRILLGCEELGGPDFPPVVDGIDVGGVCKLACPERHTHKFYKHFRNFINEIIEKVQKAKYSPGIGPLFGTFGFILLGGCCADCCDTGGCDAGCCDWLEQQTNAFNEWWSH